jgi:hypothetical protein
VQQEDIELPAKRKSALRGRAREILGCSGFMRQEAAQELIHR